MYLTLKIYRNSDLTNITWYIYVSRTKRVSAFLASCLVLRYVTSVLYILAATETRFNLKSLYRARARALYQNK